MKDVGDYYGELRNELLKIFAFTREDEYMCKNLEGATGAHVRQLIIPKFHAQTDMVVALILESVRRFNESYKIEPRQ